jgi:hypothetical protein
MVDLVALKDLLQPIFPLLGVVVGGVMAGFGQIYKARQERKRIIALALSDLLEVRHRVVTLNAVLKQFQVHGMLPTASMPHLRNILEQLIPPDTKLDDRFDEAVTLLAGMDPVFAFELRSKNLLPQFMSKLRSLASTSNEALAGHEAIESKLIEMFTPALDEAVLRVAKHHSGKSYREVKSVLASKETVGGKLSPILSGLGIDIGTQPTVATLPKKAAPSPATTTQ